MDALPDVLEESLARIIAAERREWARERERIETDARATIADLRAEIANLKVANEMLRLDVRREVAAEVERLREVAATLKSGEPGEPGKQGEQGPPGDPGRDAELDFDYINRAIADQVESRLADMQGPEGDPGRDGKDADPELIAKMVGDAVAALVLPKGDPGDPGRDGKDAEVDMEQLAALVEDRVAVAVAALPAPEPGEPGKDADPEVVRALVTEQITAAVAALELPKGDPGPQGDPGKDAEVDYDLVLRELRGDLSQMVAELPPPPKGDPGPQGDPGKDAEVDYEMVTALIAEEVERMPKPRDGVGLAGALIDRSGALVLTLTDGTVRELGQVVGRDGAPGTPGKDGLSFEAFTFEPEYDGERTLRLRWSDAKGNVQERAWRLPLMVYREIYRPGDYESGDAVRYGGSLWLAMRDTGEKPGDGCKDWRLVARAGRDGKPGKDGAPGPKGDRGPPGPERLVTGS